MIASAFLTMLAAEVSGFQPMSKWTLDNASPVCRASRSFADGENQVGLSFERTPFGLFTEIVVDFDPKKGAGRPGGKARFAEDGGAVDETTSAQITTMENGNRQLALTLEVNPFKSLTRDASR